MDVNIYVDQKTGLFGYQENVIKVNAISEQVLAQLQEMSDAERADWAKRFGRMTFQYPLSGKL